MVQLKFLRRCQVKFQHDKQSNEWDVQTRPSVNNKIIKHGISQLNPEHETLAPYNDKCNSSIGV